MNIENWMNFWKTKINLLYLEPNYKVPNYAKN